MTYLDVFDALLCALAVLVLIKFWKKFVHRPRVWVLDDSESDLMHFKMRMKLDDYDVRYFDSPKNIINQYILAVATGSAPSCIVIDYFLSENVRGDEVLHHFRNNGVKCVIVTGYQGKISNIAERDIIHKSADDSYFREVEGWIAKATGRTA